jgi:hypothetical protein
MREKMGEGERSFVAALERCDGGILAREIAAARNQRQAFMPVAQNELGRDCLQVAAVETLV